MATATFTINLNGGDIETADNALYFKIYGSANGYTTAIATTGTDIADANVSTAGGVATITNVDIGTETIFKVGVVDADGNESILSDIYTLSAGTEYFPTGNAASVSGESTATTGWSSTSSAVITADTTEKTHGASSIKLVSAADVNSRGNINVTGLTIGTPYVIKAWVKAGTGSSQMARSWSGATIAVTEFHTYTTWTEVTWNVVATATTITMRFYPSNNGVANEVLWVDKISVKSEINKIIGYPGILATSGAISNLRATQITMPEAGSIKSIWIWVDQITSSDLVLGLYSNSSALPSSLLRQATAVTTDFDRGWYKFNLNTTYSAANGEVLWLAFSPSTSVDIRYDTTAGLRATAGSGSYSATMPSTYPSPSTITARYNLFAEYLPTTPATETEKYTHSNAASFSNPASATTGVTNQNGSTPSVETTDVDGSAYVLKVASNAGASYSRCITTFSATSGKIYRLDFRAKKSHALYAGLGHDYSGAGGLVGNGYVWVTTSWANYTLYMEANATQSVDLKIWATWNAAGATGDYILVKNLSIKEIN